MIVTTATMATWVLMVRLTSPVYPEEHRAWDQNYGSIATPQECETWAKTHWQKFYNQYGKKPEQWQLKLWTQCLADAHGTKWRWTVTCDSSMNCKTAQYKGPY